MKGNCPTIYLQFCHSIFSQGHAKKGGAERKDMEGEKKRHFSKCIHSPPRSLKSRHFPPLRCNVLRGFGNSMWKLVTKQHIHTYSSQGVSLCVWQLRGLMIAGWFILHSPHQCSFQWWFGVLDKKLIFVLKDSLFFYVPFISSTHCACACPCSQLCPLLDTSYFQHPDSKAEPQHDVGAWWGGTETT